MLLQNGLRHCSDQYKIQDRGFPEGVWEEKTPALSIRIPEFLNLGCDLITTWNPPNALFYIPASSNSPVRKANFLKYS